MSSLFGAGDGNIKGPTESQAKADAMAEREQQRSETDRITSIQRQLAQETVFRNRGYGLRSLLGPLGAGKTSLLGSG